MFNKIKSFYKQLQSIENSIRRQNSKKQQFKTKLEKENLKSKHKKAPVTVKGIFTDKDNPWRIVINNSRLDNNKNELTYYEIEVFMLNTGKWETFSYHTPGVIGVEKKEFQRVCKEIFNPDHIGHYNEILFKTIEDAQEVIDAVSPYYDTYHVPHVVAERLNCYSKNGFPPYFMKYPKARKSQENEKKKLKLAE